MNWDTGNMEDVQVSVKANEIYQLSHIEDTPLEGTQDLFFDSQELQGVAEHVPTDIFELIKGVPNQTPSPTYHCCKQEE
jgi:hypothetical protein